MTLYLAVSVPFSSLAPVKGLAANPNGRNAININQQDQSGTTEALWSLTHMS
jgi:hypothetical protein